MIFSLTAEAADEARRLLARLSELLAQPASPTIEPRPLQPEDYAEAADCLGCEEAIIRAVYEVESRGHGFGPDGRPLILFEPHVFSRLTGHRFDRSHGGVSYRTWGEKPYPRGTEAERHAANWDRLAYAAQLDHAAAHKACSWGAPQIMGFNHALCGYADLDTFVAAMSAGEREQLMAFVVFVKASGLEAEMRERRWEDFARRYNGPAYARHGYHLKLAAAYGRWIGKSGES